MADSMRNVAHQLSSGMTRQFLSPTKMIVFFHGGLPYTTFDTTGAPSPWGLMKVFEAARVATLTTLPDDQRSFLDLAPLTNQILYFVISTSFRVEPEMYGPEIKKSPAWVEQDLVHVGRSSFTTSTTVYVPNIDKPLLDHVVTCVTVDPEKRMITPLPEWWVKKFATPEIRSARPFRLDSVPLLEDDIAEYKCHVRFSECDFNLHANFASYLGYCYDAFISEAVKKEKSLKTAVRRIKTLAMVYKGEADIDDQLTVKFQKNKDGDNTYRFHILNSQTQQLINESRIEFYPPSITSKL